MDDFEKVADNYKALVNESIVIPNNEADYFAAYRIKYLRRTLGMNFAGKVLDYGCGVGIMSYYVRQIFNQAELHGFDISEESIKNIPEAIRRNDKFVTDLDSLDEDYDAVILCNVMHHVDLGERQEVVDNVVKRLKKGGKLFIFEHNPANPLTQMVVDRCVFDKEAILLQPKECMDYIKKSNFSNWQKKYILFFPQQFSRMNIFDRYLAWFPLGAQYLVIGTK